MLWDMCSQLFMPEAETHVNGRPCWESSAESCWLMFGLA